jgi:MFS family permease
MGAALLAGWFLERWGFFGGFAACFLAASLIQTATVFPLGLMREPLQAAEANHPTVRPLAQLGLIREDPRMLWLCVAVAVFSLNQMAAAFYTLFAIDRLGAGDADVARFTAAVTAGRAIAFVLVGWAGDRFGNRAALQMGTAFGVVAAALAWHAPSVLWMYPVFILNEFAVQGWGVCTMNYVLELCPPERSATYTAVFGVFTGPFRVALPLLGGAVAAALGFPLLFLLGATGAVSAMLLIALRLPEPRRTVVVRNPEAAAG